MTTPRRLGESFAAHADPERPQGTSSAQTRPAPDGFDPEKFRAAVRALIASLPPPGSLRTRAEQVSYPGRPNRCCGAFLDGHRVRCGSEALPGFGLCAACSAAEMNARDRLRRERALTQR